MAPRTPFTLGTGGPSGHHRPAKASSIPRRRPGLADCGSRRLEEGLGRQEKARRLDSRRMAPTVVCMIKLLATVTTFALAALGVPAAQASVTPPTAAATPITAFFRAVTATTTAWPSTGSYAVTQNGARTEVTYAGADLKSVTSTQRDIYGDAYVNGVSYNYVDTSREPGLKRALTRVGKPNAVWERTAFLQLLPFVTTRDVRAPLEDLLDVQRTLRAVDKLSTNKFRVTHACGGNVCVSTVTFDSKGRMTTLARVGADTLLYSVSYNRPSLPLLPSSTIFKRSDLTS